MLNTRPYLTNQVGYPKQECFVQTLETTFGPYEVSGDGILFFPRHNIRYYINTDAEALTTLPEGDVYCRGYWPASWTNKLKERKVYVHKDTCTDDILGAQ
jgi:hypothetical protein